MHTPFLVWSLIFRMKWDYHLTLLLCVFVLVMLISSVARGGGGGGSSPPHWLVKYAKTHVFCAFEADFLWKMENSPPHTKRAPLRRLNLRNLGEKSLWILAKTFFFFFGDHLILGGKNVWIPDFGRKITLNFGEDLFFFFFFFFFWRSPNFGRKKPLNFRCFRGISSQISDKPSETDSRSMKIRVNVVCTLLTLSK